MSNLKGGFVCIAVDCMHQELITGSSNKKLHMVVLSNRNYLSNGIFGLITLKLGSKLLLALSCGKLNHSR